jgi:glyceraldehyde 3-phosphate dehydrogenase
MATPSARTSVGGSTISLSPHSAPGDVPWDELGVDLVLECSGRFRTPETLAPYFERACAR